MKESQVPITALPGDFVTSDDQQLFAFIDSLRNSVREKVSAGQRRGLSLAEIVVEVREMVRFAEEDPDLPTPFSSHAYKAISRQAVAWCIEAYQPLVIPGGNELPAQSAAFQALPTREVPASKKEGAAATRSAQLPIN